MLHLGDQVPDFALPLARADGTKSVVSFRSLLAHGPVVISFFPLAFTGVCTRQMCEMRDRQGLFDELGATAVGFSIDSVYTNVAYARANSLRHGIFSDANRDVVHRIWETQEVVGVKDVAKRGWLVVARDGTVTGKWVTDDPEEWSGLQPVEDALATTK